MRSLKYRNRFWFILFHPKATYKLAKVVWKLTMSEHYKDRED